MIKRIEGGPAVDCEETLEAFQQEALTAWDAFQATGLHVTAEEANAWMAKLEQGIDIEPPEPHQKRDEVLIKEAK